MWGRKKRFQHEAFVKATCPLCGDVMVTANCVVVSATAATASLVCPVCDEIVVVPLCGDADLLLLANGAEVVL